jgi:hypothetical protein
MTNDNCLEGIKCPQCGNEDRFFISCTTLAVVTDEGAQAYGDMEWGDESSAVCSEFQKTGPLRDFRRKTQLPPDLEGMNDSRARWAEIAVAAFIHATGTDREDALPELLCDLMHWCDRNEYDFEIALDRARWHYEAETAKEDS